MEGSSNYTVSKKGQDIYLTPKDGKHTETLIFMHGLGDSAAGWFDIFMESSMNIVLPTTKVVLLTAPIAPVTANNGYQMPSWYDIKQFGNKDIDGFEKTIGKDEVKENAERIQRVLDKEIELLKGESKSVIIGGFSQGCAMSMYTGLQYNKSLAGIMGWSGYLFPWIKVSPENENVPIFLSHGTDDQVVPHKMSELTFQRLDVKKHQMVKVIEKGMEHSISDRILKEAGSFIRTVLKKAK